MHKGYFGSVRFFKNLILLVVVICIAVPTALSTHYYFSFSESSAEADELKMECASLQSKNASLTSNLADAQALAGFVDGEAPAYQSLFPDFYAGQPLTADKTADHTIYLTFDDGPSARTPEILKTLKEENVKATFFVVGKTDKQSLQWMKDIVAEGHTLGMHSYTHNYKKIYASVEDYLTDMYQLFCLIRDTTGTTPVVFRMAGGSINGYNYGIYHEILSEMLRRGFVPYDWNLSSGDASERTIKPEQICQNVLSSVDRFSRGFVLMHDSAAKGNTVKALPDLIHELKARGYVFDRLTGDVKPVLFTYTDYHA